MNKQQIVVNTIAFAEQVQQGLEQKAFFVGLAELGVQSVEVRQEYFSGSGEFEDTAREAAKYGLTLLYSVPKQLFRNGCLDRVMVDETLREASLLSAVSIKWTRGEFTDWHADDIDWMRRRVASVAALLTIENDQTVQDGTLNNYLEFLSRTQEVGLPLYSTFDIGNWAWVGEDPLHNARQLSPYVKYIHVKDVRQNLQMPEAAPLGAGELALLEVFAELPKNLQVAVEYPCGSQPFQLLKGGIQWLESHL